MSVNYYDSSTSSLVTLAGGQRLWLGTQEAYNAEVTAGTMPTNCLVAIIDDGAWDLTSEVTEGDDTAVTSGGVYDALLEKEDILTWDSTPTNGSSNPVTSDGIYDALAEKSPTLVGTTYSFTKTFGTDSTSWTATVTNSGYTPITWTLFNTNSAQISWNIETVTLSSGSFGCTGYGRSLSGDSLSTTCKIRVLWVKDE